MSNSPVTLRQVGGYTLVRCIDESPYASVFRVRHAVLETDHALKIAHASTSRSIGVAMTLGAQLQARVLHANVVRVTDAGAHDGRPWFVMDWSPGASLADWIDRERVTLARVPTIVRGIVRGVAAIHDSGVVHRDLKPDNVLMVERGRRVTPRITDLALAKLRPEGEVPRAEGLSAEYSTLGTPGYMAPEQFENVGLVDHRADLFSLGCVLYELLTGHCPFDDEEEMMIFAKVSKGEYPPVKMLQPAAPDVLCTLVDDLLEVDPDDRPASAAAVLSRL